MPGIDYRKWDALDCSDSDSDSGGQPYMPPTHEGPVPSTHLARPYDDFPYAKVRPVSYKTPAAPEVAATKRVDVHPPKIVEADNIVYNHDPDEFRPAFENFMKDSKNKKAFEAASDEQKSKIVEDLMAKVKVSGAN